VPVSSTRTRGPASAAARETEFASPLLSRCDMVSIRISPGSPAKISANSPGDGQDVVTPSS